MSFERDYNELLSFAKGRIQLMNFKLDERDIVSSVFIEMSGKEYSIESAKKLVFKEIRNHVNIDSQYLAENVTKINSYNDTQKTCPMCNQVLPNILFYRYCAKATHKYVYSTYCKKCSSEISKEYYKQNRDRGLLFRKQYRNKTKDPASLKYTLAKIKNSNADKAYSNKIMKDMTTGYIKTVIRRHFKGEITDGMILKKKEDLIKRREKHGILYHPSIPKQRKCLSKESLKNRVMISNKINPACFMNVSRLILHMKNI